MTTPLLIVHSENDLRCPVNQAEELFVALRLLGRTPEFVRFPGESHELTRSGAPSHRMERAEIILDFFRRHLVHCSRRHGSDGSVILDRGDTIDRRFPGLGTVLDRAYERGAVPGRDVGGVRFLLIRRGVSARVKYLADDAA